MSKYVAVKDSNGFNFSHNFSSADWREISTLEGKRNGRVDFSEGSAAIDGGTIFITLNGRTYDLSASDLF